MISLIAAVSKNGVIGSAGRLPWNCPTDLRHFSRTTTGHTVVMGRKTYESLPGPLRNRENVVLSSGTRPPGLPDIVAWESSMPDRLLRSDKEVFVIGGSSLYRHFLKERLIFCERIYITRILADVDGDTFFPQIDNSIWLADDENPPIIQGKLDEYPMQFLTYRRW
jgi:dihydrofolate reductase